MEENKHKLSPEALRTAEQVSDFDSAVEPGGLILPPKAKVADLPLHTAPHSAADDAPKADASAPDATHWKKILQPYAQKRSVRIGMAISDLNKTFGILFE